MISKTEIKKTKVKLDGVAETLLIPLWARAEEWNKFNPIIMDEQAVELVNQIDYDFSKFKKNWMSQTGCSIRAKILDTKAKRFIKKNPNAIVINIGCGLDTRFFRVDNGKIKWYELDLPESMNLRKNFFSENERYKMIGKSVFDFSWIDDIEYDKKKNEPVLIIAEGTLMYFSEKEVKEIFSNLIETFKGAEMLIEVITPFMVRSSKKHETLKKMEGSPIFKWGLKRPQKIVEMNSKIKFLDASNMLDMYKERWKWGNYVFTLFGKAKFSDNIVRVKFN